MGEVQILQGNLGARIWRKKGTQSCGYLQAEEVARAKSQHQRVGKPGTECMGEGSGVRCGRAHGDEENMGLAASYSLKVLGFSSE